MAGVSAIGAREASQA